MVLSHEDPQDGSEGHPFWYACIIGIFHANVKHVGPGSTSTEPRRVDFLWVRWFGCDLSHASGWKAKRLHRLGFIPADDPDVDTFGFLDPEMVIRAVHLIPAFAYGRTSRLLRPSIVHQEKEENEDWVYYYINT